jgi:RNA polymerase sigma-70 factor, ECF subfamily
VALTAIDRSILQRCLQHDVGAWNDFVDRFLGLVYHVIHYTAHLRSNPLKPDVVEDIAQEIMTEIAASDYALLKAFRGKSSLATYLTVIARRICVREFSKRRAPPRKPLPPEFQHRAATKQKTIPAEPFADENDDSEEQPKAQAGMESLDLLQRLIRKLPSREREVVRLFYFEGRTYEEISIELNLPVKTIGPILKRARQLLRKFEDKMTEEAAAKKGEGGS